MRNIHTTTMDFSPLINDYKDNDSEVSSPIWIWFQKKEKNDVICQNAKQIFNVVILPLDIAINLFDKT